MTPPHITSFQRFNADSAAKACKCYLPEHDINSAADLLGEVSGTFGIDLDALRILMRDQVTSNDREVQIAIENWLISYGITKKQYLCFVVNRCKPIDGLFVWLVVHTTRNHLNILHASGVWTSRRSDITVLMDASVILVVNCTLHTPKMSHEAIKKCNDEYVELLCDPRLSLHNFVSMPRILNNPIWDVAEWMEEIGLWELQADGPIQNPLAFLLECNVSAYQLQLVRWIYQYKSDVPIIVSWLAIYGLTVDEYMALLEQQREREWWSGSLGSLYGSRTAHQCYLWWHGLVYVCGGVWLLPSLLLTCHATVVLCEEIPNEDDLSYLGVAGPPPMASSTLRPVQHGYPIVPIPEYPAQLDSDHMDTDPNDLLTAEAMVHPPILNAGQAIPRTCSVCDMGLPLGIALCRHMRLVHPHDKLYSCKDCGSMYNNLKELSSHHSNVHWAAIVSCAKCDYASISKAWMRQHVRRHTTGFICQKCGKGFLTLTELARHEHLYNTCKTFEYDQCDSEYYMVASLRIHQTGKHGEGYCCLCCGLYFDTLSQHIHHKWNCH